ncbi:MAG: hypothetical protein R3F65_15530 [bacterium]|nr:hypothetical protein [Myxococcales bacterium]
MNPCQQTRAIIAAFAAGHLRDDPQLSAHLQVCTHCLGAVFGHYRQHAAPPSPPAGPNRSEPDTLEP